MTETLKRMKNLGVKHTDMIKALRKHGITVYPSQLSNILHEVVYNHNAERIIAVCNDILDDYETKVQSIALV